MPPPADLIHANVGAYFASKGFITVIPDYRLSPGVTHPAPAEDVRDAVIWITENTDSLNNGTITDVDFKSIFFIGHSVGANLTMSLWLLSLLPENVQIRCKGVTLISGPYTSDGTLNPEVATHFFGSLEKAKENTPFTLLNNFPKDKLSTLPDIYLVEAERDPGPFLLTGKHFHGTLSSLTGRQVPKSIGQGHNHISITVALMTGQGEQWAEEVVKWMQAAI